MSVNVGNVPDQATQEPGNGVGKFLLDPYKDWAEGEGIPIHYDFGHDLIALETGPWDRYDAHGCFAHTHGMGDFMTNYVIEVGPTRKTRPVKHLYEAFFYVLTGHGSTSVWLPDGQVRTFEWGPKALFAIPLNCRYQIMNASGVGAGAAVVHQRRPAADQPVPQRRLRLRQRRRLRRPCRRGRALRGRGRALGLQPGLGQGPERLGDELRPRPDQLQAVLVRGPGQGLAERELRAGRRHDALARLADAGRPVQEGPPARRRNPRPCRRRGGLLAALVRGRLRVQASSRGGTDSCTRRRSGCSTSTSTPASSRPATWPAASAAGAIRSSRCGARAPRGRGDLGVEGWASDRVRGSGPAGAPDVPRGTAESPGCPRRWATSSTSRHLALPADEALTGVIQTPASTGPAV